MVDRICLGLPWLVLALPLMAHMDGCGSNDSHHEAHFAHELALEKVRAKRLEPLAPDAYARFLLYEECRLEARRLRSTSAYSEGLDDCAEAFGLHPEIEEPDD